MGKSYIKKRNYDSISARVTKNYTKKNGCITSTRAIV